MRLYEATLYHKPNGYTRPIPVTIDGHEVSREMVAETASKGRYSFFLDLRDAWGESVRLQDIRMRSLSKEAPRPSFGEGWEERLENANAIIRVIGSHGRHFLSENADRAYITAEPFFAHFTADKRNELWFVDRYTRKPILVRHSKWPAWSDGGTLRDLVEQLADYIWYANKPINMRVFGPWPQWSCGGDLWGYGDDMQKVRDEIAAVLAVTR